MGEKAALGNFSDEHFLMSRWVGTVLDWTGLGLSGNCPSERSPVSCTGVALESADPRDPGFLYIPLVLVASLLCWSCCHLLVT